MPMLTMSVIALAGVAAPGAARGPRSAKRAHAVEHRVDLGHDVLAVDQDRPVGAVAQGDVQHGAVLGGVDLLAGEHPGRASPRRRRAGRGRAAAAWSRRVMRFLEKSSSMSSSAQRERARTGRDRRANRSRRWTAAWSRRARAAPARRARRSDASVIAQRPQRAGVAGQLGRSRPSRPGRHQRRGRPPRSRRRRPRWAARGSAGLLRVDAAGRAEARPAAAARPARP